MNVPRYAATAAKLLQKQLATSVPAPSERERGLATIQEAMRARSKRRRIWTLSSVAAAASLLLAAGLVSQLGAEEADVALISIRVSPAGEGAALRTADRNEALANEARLSSGQRIETPIGGGASLQLSTGSSMSLAGGTSFRVDSHGAVERFSLQRGEVSAHVSKLSQGQRFIVRTPDAELEVRGTRFRAQVLPRGEACGGQTRTRLTVTEGVVEVRRDGVTTPVSAGQHWPADCASDVPPRVHLETPEQAAGSVSPTHPSQDTGSLHVASNAASPTQPDAVKKSSALTQQNDLFAEGVALRRQGDVGAALRAYQELIARFPTSPLAENAMVERIRLLSGRHDPRARTEAAAYLKRYPHGFAVIEARQLMVEP